jgi:putative ATP-dependent endonuclease of OLD family
MLTFIAELKDQQNVIFAMEEPELALPPHTQRRVTRFVLGQMGQGIVTSHSPYVIEQFEPSQIVVLNRSDEGRLIGKPIDLHGIKPRAFAKERRQFAEAVLACAILVVEGATEAAVFPAASTVMEQDLGAKQYSHFDIAGVSVFDAGGEGSAPAYGPFFKALGKPAFCMVDKPKQKPSDEAVAKLKDYQQFWESPEHGFEALLINESSETLLRRFLSAIKDRADYPAHVGTVTDDLTTKDVRSLAQAVLEARKGNLYGYGAMLVAECQSAAELPPTIRTVLEEIHKALNPTPVRAEGIEQPIRAAAVPPSGESTDVL